MSKQTNNRIEKLEHISVVKMATAVCAIKGNQNPTNEHLERVVEFMRPDNLHAFILHRLQRQIDNYPK